jgi:3'-phosphoadenosine 5'-phosphosulfate sulfotransferase (PAPS reductase)/FAD synthetase
MTAPDNAPMTRNIVWFSCGAASAVAANLTARAGGNVVLAYCETGAEHPDNERFLADVGRWTGQTVTRLRSEKYASTWDVWEQRRWLSGVQGALCTVELKVIPRINFQRPHDVHVFGYTADLRDVTRAARLRANYPELTIETPLIERGLRKAECLAMVERAGIALPPMYAMGFQNNNCIPCVKATSPDYWALVRQRFPAEFERMATLSRELGVRLSRLPDPDNPQGRRIFIDEIPADWPTTNPIQPSCDFLCHIAEHDLMDAAE